LYSPNFSAARNPNALPEDLDMLETDPVPGVRGAVAERTKSARVLWRRLRDTDFTVRESAKRNPLVKGMTKTEFAVWEQGIEKVLKPSAIPRSRTDSVQEGESTKKRTGRTTQRMKE